MSSALVQSLRGRISELEADNTELSHAIEHATSVAESFGQQSAENRELLAERDEEVQHLRALLERERELNNEFSDEVDILKRNEEERQHKIVAFEETEKSYRQTILKLEQSLNSSGDTRSSDATSSHNSGSRQSESVLLLSCIDFYKQLIYLLYGEVDSPKPGASRTGGRTANMVYLVINTRMLLSLSTVGVSNVMQHLATHKGNKDLAALRKTMLRVQMASKALLSKVLHALEMGSDKKSGELDFDKMNTTVHTLLERVCSCVGDVLQPSFPVTAASPVDVQTGLLDLAVEALKRHVGVEDAGGLVEVSADIEERVHNCVAAALKHEQERKDKGEGDEKEADNSAPSGLSSDMLVEKLRKDVALRDKKLDDAVVRCQAFEDALNRTRQQAAQLQEQLKEQTRDLQSKGSAISNGSASGGNKGHGVSDLKHGDLSAASSSATQRGLKGTRSSSQHGDERDASDGLSESSEGAERQLSKEERAAAGSEGKKGEVIGRTVASTLQADDQRRRNWNRLRSSYLQGAINDLKLPPSSHSSVSSSLMVKRDRVSSEFSLQSTHNTMKNALYHARLAAANAHVLKLDKHTLKPTTSGDTMSHQPVQHALQTGRRYEDMLSNAQRNTAASSLMSCKTSTTNFQLVVPEFHDAAQTVRSFQSFHTQIV